MTLASLLRSWIYRRGKRFSTCSSMHLRRLQFEMCEDRCLLTTISITSPTFAEGVVQNCEHQMCLEGSNLIVKLSEASTETITVD